MRTFVTGYLLLSGRTFVTGNLLLCTLLTALLTNCTDKFAGAIGGLHNGLRLMKPPT